MTHSDIIMHHMECYIGVMMSLLVMSHEASSKQQNGAFMMSVFFIDVSDIKCSNES